VILSFIKTAWRNLQKQRLYSLISLFSLAVGLTYFIMIAVLEDVQFHADTFHADADRIYGVVQVNDAPGTGEKHSAFNAGPLLAALRSEFPEIEDGTRILPVGRQIVEREDESFYETGIVYVEPNFLQMFSFPLTRGSRATALSEPYSAVLSEDAAKKYFGDADPIGRTLAINQKVSISVSGVAKNVNDSSSIKFSFLVSMDAAQAQYPELEEWEAQLPSTFVRLAKGHGPGQLDDKLRGFVRKYYPESPKSPKRLYLFPLLDFRLKALKPVAIDTPLSRFPIEVVYMQVASAVVVLLIACVNFMCLMTAGHMRRAKEIGLRKTMGASRGELAKQFVGESVVLTLMALPIALALYSILFPAMTSYMGTKDLPVWNHPFLFRYVLGVTVLVGIFAGSYPALVLSAFRPVQALKGAVSLGRRGSRLHKALVVTQLALSIFLIMWTLMFKKQFNRLLVADFGYDRDQVLAVSVKGVPLERLDVLRNEISRHPSVVSVSAASGLPGVWGPTKEVIPEGKDESERTEINAYGVGHGFNEAMGIGIVEGRGFSRDFNDADSLVITKSMAREMGWSQPVGRRVSIDGVDKTVVGVCRNFQFRYALERMAPAFLYLETEKLTWLLIKSGPDQGFQASLDLVRDTWKATLPQFPFEWMTLDDRFMTVYAWMDRVYVVMTFVDSFVVLVTSLGLLALASHAVERRTKEVGIRRALGAPVTSIMSALSKEFIILVLLANLIAMPAAAWVAQWLMQVMITFQTVTVDFRVIFLTAFLTLAAAFLAVFSQVWRAARKNPVESLRYE